MKATRAQSEAWGVFPKVPRRKTEGGRKKRRPAVPVPRETSIVAACKFFLETHGAVVIRNNSGARKIGKYYVRFGEPGSADLVVCLRGRYVAVEVKRPGEKARPSQVAWLDQVRRAEGLALVVSSVNQLAMALQVEDLL